MECLSRVISYTVFIAFLYFLTVITHPPTTTNPCLLYPKNFIFWPLPNLFSSSVGGQIRPAAPGGQGDVETSLWQVPAQNILIYLLHLHTHTYLHFLNESFWTGGSASLWNSSRAERGRWWMIPRNKRDTCSNLMNDPKEWVTVVQILWNQAGELGSRVEDWVEEGVRYNSLLQIQTSWHWIVRESDWNIQTNTLALICSNIQSHKHPAGRGGGAGAAPPPREEELSAILWETACVQCQPVSTEYMHSLKIPIACQIYNTTFFIQMAKTEHSITRDIWAAS